MKIKINDNNINKTSLDEGQSYLEISYDIQISVPVNKTDYAVSTRNVQNKISYPKLFSHDLYSDLKETVLRYSNCRDASFAVSNIKVKQIQKDGSELANYTIFDDLKLHPVGMN